MTKGVEHQAEPATQQPDAPNARRRFGQWGEKYGWKAPDVFPETTEEEIALWEDGPVFPPDDPA